MSQANAVYEVRDDDPSPSCHVCGAVMERKCWRVGRNVAINVYEMNRPVCQCQTVADAKRIVAAVNATTPLVWVCLSCGATTEAS